MVLDALDPNGVIAPEEIPALAGEEREAAGASLPCTPQGALLYFAAAARPGVCFDRACAAFAEHR
jgi:hypothetical protein